MTLVNSAWVVMSVDSVLAERDGSRTWVIAGWVKAEEGG